MIEKLELMRRIWWFVDGHWDPYDNGLNPGDSYLRLSNSAGTYIADVFEVICDSGNESYDALLATNRGLIVQKDIAAGGYISANQGELWLGSGREDQVDVPKIVLTQASTSRLTGGGPFSMQAVPSGTTFPTEEDGAVAIRTDSWGVNPANTLYKYNGTWEPMGPTSNYTGNFDTLYLRKFSSGTTDQPAHLDLGNLTAHGDVSIHCPGHLTWKIVSATNDHLQFITLGSLKADIDSYGSLWLAGWLTVAGQTTFYDNVTLAASANIYKIDGAALKLGQDTKVEHAGPVCFNVNSTNSGNVSMAFQTSGTDKLQIGCTSTYNGLHLISGNLDLYADSGNIAMGAGGGYIYSVGQIVPNTPGSGQIGNTSNYYYAMVADYFYSRGGGSGSEIGSVGTSSHRFVSGYIRTVYTLGGGQYDMYDDLAIVKQWGEKNQTLPSDYDPKKAKPEGAPFDFLKAKNENGEVDDYYNLNELVSFNMCCTKALAKKNDENNSRFEALLSKIEDLQSQIQQLKQTASS